MHPAIAFLHQLDQSPSATFNIEAYSDVPKGGAKPSPDPLAKRYSNLTCDEVSALLPDLGERNAAGAAIYVAVNQCRGERTKANISRVRGVHADFDGVDAQTLERVREILLPSIEVQSSTPDRRHFYWLLNEDENPSVEAAEQINRGLVDMGADPAAIDASRLLRLPGFRHMKGWANSDQEFDTCPVTQVVASGPRYTWEAIEAALPKRNVRQRPHSGKLPVGSIDPADHVLIDQAIAAVQQAEPLLWAGRWQEIKGLRQKPAYPSQSEADLVMASRIARCLSEMGSPIEKLPALTEAVFGQCALAQRDKWASRAGYRISTISRACAAFSNAPVTSQSTTQVEVDWDLQGDVRNARYFADKWAGELAYIFDQKCWMQWDGDRWVRCSFGEEVEHAKATCQAIYSAAGQVLTRDPERGKRLAREAAQAHLAQRLKAMVELARSDPKLSVPSTRLDADNYVLGVQNGVVDLRRGTLLPNRPELWITRYAAASYVVDAQCPRWMQFLDEVFDADRETITAVQRLLGYTLTGLSTEEILVFCVGFGANGKSIFGNVVAAILGDYAKAAPSTLLAARRADDHGPRPDLAMLDGVRLVSINELPAGLQLDEQVVKQFAGREPISARHLYAGFSAYQPRFTGWVRTNHKPIIKGDDDGIWRRIVILPFRRRFSEEDRDPGLEAKLMAERDGILGWMIQGAVQYLKLGLHFSPLMNAERTQYRKESDLLGEFLDERTTPDSTARVEQGEFYLSWVHWCQQNGAHPGSKKSFTQRLAERGVATGKSNGRRYYTGVSKVAGGLF